MTDFERDVAAALDARYWPTEPRNGAPPIATVVAAAIEAARITARTHAASDEGGLWSKLAAEKAAIAALRGKSGEPTP